MSSTAAKETAPSTLERVRSLKDRMFPLSFTRAQLRRQYKLGISENLQHAIIEGGCPPPLTEDFKSTSRTDAVYQYQSLVSPEHFRLITLYPAQHENSDPIRCTISQSRIGDEEYEALSYEWGVTGPDDTVILVDNVRVRVRRNLYDALWNMRNSRSMSVFKITRILWIDALCIDQGNDRERNHQVKLMGRIYSTAFRVVVWLGLHDANSETAIDVLNKIYEGRGSKIWSDIIIAQPDSTFKAIELLCTRSYWYRMWVIQEFHLAKALKIRCGYSSTSGEAFAFAARLFTGTLHGHRSADLTARLDDSHRWGARSDRPDFVLADMGLWESVAISIHVHRKDARKAYCFAEWLEDAVRNNLLCSEPRDMLYAFLGVSADIEEGDVLPQYEKPVAEVLVDALRLCMKTKPYMYVPQNNLAFTQQLARRMGLDWTDQQLTQDLLAKARQN